MKENRRERYVIFSFSENGTICYLNKTESITYAEEFSEEFIEDIGKDINISIKIFFLKRKEKLYELREKIKNGNQNALIEIKYSNLNKRLTV